MAYPWPSFSTILFQQAERPLAGSDTGWKRTPKRDRSANLGSATDSIVTLAIGSATRSWEAHFEPDRFDALEALVGSTDTLTDWEAPVPDSRAAYLESIEKVADVAVLCTDNVTRRKLRAKVTFISQ